MRGPSGYRSRSGGAAGEAPLFAALAGPVVLVAAAGLIGWLLLIAVKALVVVLLYCIGAALVVVPLVWGRALLGSTTGPARRHRIGSLATTVVVGVALMVVAHLVSRHGWLLIAVPAVLVLLGRIGARISSARMARRQRDLRL